MPGINLRTKQFNLTNDDISWVEQTLATMDLRAKAGQLFCLVAPQEDLTELLQKLGTLDIKPGGFMSRPFAGTVVQKNYRHLQNSFEIPLLLAANLERGGSGIALDGTNFASQMQVAATDDETMAYRLGLICGREGRAVGCNWTFSPVVDIDFNYQNPITNTRTFGSDPDRVLRMARAYTQGVQECGLAVSLKHWPGDGVDGRDQHLLTSVNTLSVETLDKTFGKIYAQLIAAGANTVMAGHIMQPAYSKKLRPDIRDEDILPASLAPELNNQLLREQLGFNGLIVNDATSMAGFTIQMQRERAVPASIAAGCDMFLLSIDLEEDFDFMLAGIQNGILTQARLDDAVTRILALKASLRLHEQKAQGTPVPDASALQILNCAEHRAWATECADKAITLVKDTQNILPLSPEKHKRILLYVLGDTGGYMDLGGSSSKRFVALLQERGFAVTEFDYGKTQGATMYKHSFKPQPVNQFKREYDLVLYFASLKTASNQTIVRISWAKPMGIDVPKFVNEIPTVFVSVENPYHLQDVPRVKTYINGYTSSDYVVEALVDKLLGKSSFKGTSPVDPFCNLWDAHL